MGELSKLPNIGKTVEEQLVQVGIQSITELKEIAVDRITPIKNLIEQLENNDIHEMMEQIEKNEKINNESLKKYVKKEKKS